MALWLLWRRRAVWPLVPPAVVGLALLPLLRHQNDEVARPWADAFTLADQVKATVQEFLLGHQWTDLIHRPAFAVLALLWGIALWWLWRARERRAVLPLALAAVAIALPVLISLVGTNYLAPRNVLAAWPLLAIAVGAGAATAKRGPAVIAAACVLSTAIVVAGWFDARLQRDDWRALLDPDPAPAVVVADGFNHVRVVARYLDAERPARSAEPGDVAVVGHVRNGEDRFAAPPVAGATLVSSRREGSLRLTVWRAPAPVPAPPGDALLVTAP
jgi:hypothetical protein